MNTYISSIAGSASIELMAKARSLKENGVDVISLAGGEPDFDTPDVVKEVAIRELRNGNTHYAVGKGILPLRKRIQKKLKQENGVEISAENILVTPGAKMAIYLAIRACINIGDEVIVFTPSWVSYQEIVKASGGIPIEVELLADDQYSLDREVLLEKINEKTKMIIVNSPNNPTGKILTEADIAILKEIAISNDLVILSDEIYEHIIFDGKKNISLASDKELAERTITINGFSKAYAMTGWRLGYLAASERYLDAINKLYTHTITGTPPFIQEAAVVAMDCIDDVNRMNAQYQSRRDLFTQGLNELPGVTAVVPDGAFYAWVKFGIDGLNSEDVAMFLLEKAKVVGVPGNAYGKGGEGYIRFSFANSEEDLVNAVQRIKTALQERKGRINEQ